MLPAVRSVLALCGGNFRPITPDLVPVVTVAVFSAIYRNYSASTE